MASIIPTTGLVSGLQTADIINALVASQNNILSRLKARGDNFKSTQLGLTTLSAKLLTLSTSASSLSLSANFQKFKATSSDAAQLSVTAAESAVPGDYQFQVLRLATSNQVLSKGFSNSTQQTLGTGTITVASGGRLSTDTALDSLNGGAGVRRGVIRITDRSGASADIDLSAAATVTDVLNAINNASGITVTAQAQGDKLVLTDGTGLTVSNLIVAERSGGHTAEDLGLKQSVAGDSLNGSSVYQLTGSFALSKLNDGNGLRLSSSQADLRIGLTDPAETTLDVDLSGATTLGEVVSRINSHTSNAGKLTASISDGRVVLTDNTGGGGPNALTVSSLNGSNAAAVLGLEGSVAGNALGGHRILAGLNSVLLRNLRGGRGIDSLGSLTLTDRAGTTATLDLSGAESLDDVLSAINAARDGVGTKLAITAEINGTGNGLVLQDTSGQTASNLIVADAGGSTLAAQLGIATDSSQTEVQSGNLKLRYVNEATSLSKYAPGGVDVRRGAIAIRDSAGIDHFVNISTDLKTIGDVLQQINSGTGGQVTAELNETGDGIVLIDQAGGSGALSVRDLDSQSAADLRLLGTASNGTDGKSRVSGRQAAVITLSETDTLQTLADKLNAAKAGLNAAVLDDGSSFSPKRLVLTSKTSGSAGRFLVDDGGLGLGLNERVRGQDALLRIGADAATGFVVSNSTNVFDSAVSGLTLTAKAAGANPATVSVTRDSSKLSDILNTFVKNYNDVATLITDVTKFDAEKNQKGALQGDGLTLRVANSLSSLVGNIGYGAAGTVVRSLGSLGITLGNDGKLDFDTARFNKLVETDPQAVSDFFLNDKTGFGGKLKAIVESFTDPTTGKLTAADKAAKTSVDNLEARMTAVQAQIDARKQRLLLQFSNLEKILSGLNSQQSALDRLAAAAKG